MSFYCGWLSGIYRILSLSPGDIKSNHQLNDILPPIDLAYPHTQHSHISVWIAISNSIFVVWRHQLIVGYPYTVDIPTDVSNWYDRSHRHRSNQSLIIRTSSFFTQPKLTINQWLLICYIAILAHLARCHSSIPHGDNCRRVFVLIRWLLYMQYPDGWLLYSLPLADIAATKEW